MWNEIRFGLAAVLMILALGTLCTGVMGIFRFRDTLQRMHAAAVNDTLGLFLAVCALILAEGISFVSLKYALILVFLWIASPMSSHLIARMAANSRKGTAKAKETGKRK